MKLHNSFFSGIISIPRSVFLTKALFFIFILTSVFILPSIIHNQIVTGSFVNAGLLMASSVFGLPAAIILAVAPSLVAFSRGLLPVAFIPVIPFIMISNIFFILIFRTFAKKPVIAGITASLVKFMFLFLVGQLLLSHLVMPNILQKASLMLGWFQLITALIGSGIAVSALRIYRINR